MQMDLDYVKELLSFFVNDDKAFQFSDDIPVADDDVEKFVFHVAMFSDLGLLSDSKGFSDLASLGIRSDLSGEYYFSGTRIRLTAKGHDFYKSLCSSEVLERLKSDFKDAPFEVMYKVGQELIDRVFKRKFDQLLGE